MALSMFLRSPACTSRFQQQLVRFSTQSLLQNSSCTSVVPLKKIAPIEANKFTPILNSVRDFRTTMVRLSDEKPHDHAKLWVVEKMTTAIMVPLIPAALIMPNKLFDFVLATLIVAHSFWGMEAMVVEYVRVILVGPVVPKIAMGVVYGITVVTLGGLFYLIFNDIGMCRSFWKIWRNMRKPVDKKRGLEAIAVDYVRAAVVGPILPKIALGLVYLISIATLGGLFYLISHDIGLAGSVRQLWAVKSEQRA